MIRFLIPAVVAAVAVVTALAHGSLTGRWVKLPPLDAYTTRLQSVPLNVGDWTGEEVPLADSDGLERAGIAAFIHRRYTSQASGEQVIVLVVCGRPGPISVHTPDVCYRGSGYIATGDPQVSAVEAPGRRISCQRLHFRPPAGRVGAGDLDIRWAWVADGTLQAPDNPRITFSGQPALYKVYLIRESMNTGAAAKSDPSAPFVAAFIPALEEALRPAG